MDFASQAVKSKRVAEFREVAGMAVAQTFFGALLRQVRQSPWKSELFGGGRGGEAYQQLLDQKLVEGMARGSGASLVDAFVKRYAGKLNGPTPFDLAPQRRPESKPDAQQMPVPSRFQRPVTPRDLKQMLREGEQPEKRYGSTAITA